MSCAYGNIYLIARYKLDGIRTLAVTTPSRKGRECLPWLTPDWDNQEVAVPPFAERRMLEAAFAALLFQRGREIEKTDNIFLSLAK